MGVRTLTFVSAAAAALGLAGCGFTPLYATQGVTPALTHIEVAAPHGRQAFLIGQSLDDALGKDRADPPVYRLKIVVSERVFSRGLSLNNVAERYEDHVRVTYTLVDIASGRTLTSEAQPIEVSFPATDQPYAGLSAQQEAEQRAADEAAQQIRLDLAAYFVAHRAKP